MTLVSGALAGLLVLVWTVAPQVPEELMARLKNPSEVERSAALVALGKLQAPDVALLNVIAESLLDRTEDVRLAAAYSLASVAGKVGCKVIALTECKLLKDVLDSTPKRTGMVPPEYPTYARNVSIQGAVRLEGLIREDGSVDRIRVIDGPLELRDAAMASFQKWHYRPASRSGKPVPFATVVTITFTLS